MDSDWLPWIWLAAALIGAAIEIPLTASALAFLWLAAAIVGVSTLVLGAPASLGGQLLLFAASGAALYPLLRRLRPLRCGSGSRTTGDIHDQLADAPTGRIDDDTHITLDRAFLGERRWRFDPASPEAARRLTPGTRARITEINGNVLTIEPLEESS
ncbi:MAG: hypothetical protein R8K47_00480 [Mariprofundaceae bacterium]